MSKKLDDFIGHLQERIYEETKAALGQKDFERWLNPKYKGIIKNPDGYASITGSCGDTMQIFLKFENESVIEATFQTDGCGSSTFYRKIKAFRMDVPDSDGRGRRK